jgi:tetratricopeptide (TPR) repeat protein
MEFFKGSQTSWQTWCDRWHGEGPTPEIERQRVAFRRRTFVADSEQLIGQANAEYQAGQLYNVERLCRQALSQGADGFEVLYLLGSTCHALGKLQDAVVCLQRSVGLQPNFAPAHGNLGNALKGLGRFQEAADCYRRVLALEPDSALAHNDLGTIAQAQRNIEEAVTHFRRAVELDANFADAHTNLGIALALQGKHDEAEACCRRAIELRPDFAEAHHDLGSVLTRQQRYAEAAASYRRAAAIRPSYVEAHFRLGTVLTHEKKWDEAEAAYGRALSLQPLYAEAHNNLGLALWAQRKLDEAVVHLRRYVELQPRIALGHYNLGLVLREQKKVDEAIASFRRTVELQPDFAPAHSNLGVALSEQKKYDAAAACFARALELAPDSIDTRYNLGNALVEQNRFPEAEACYKHVLEQDSGYTKAYCGLSVALMMQLRYPEAEVAARRYHELLPDSALAHSNVGDICVRQERYEEGATWYRGALELNGEYASAYHGMAVVHLRHNDLEEALRCCERALALDPNLIEAHFNRAWISLMKGHFADGWEEYEWRFKCRGRSEDTLPKPQWDGSSLEGRSILLRTEQGFGDAMQFIRYAELVKQRGATVIVECRPQVKRILATCPGVDRVIVEGQPRPNYDFHIPLMSLPRIFATSLATIPCHVPYLEPDPEAAAAWKAEMSGNPAFKVGIDWHGSKTQVFGGARSIPLKYFASLARVPGVQLYSLQIGFGREELTEADDHWPIIDLGDRLGDFSNTGAIMSNLDLVITCDSAPAHLAGALGLPVWVALTLAHDWRWMQERTDSPWYPTMRLFRQATLGDWPGVFQRIENALSDLLSS